MARIAGVDLPPAKRAESRAYLYFSGVGRTRSRSLLYRAGIEFDKKVRDLTRTRSTASARFWKRKAPWKATSARKFSMNIKRHIRWGRTGAAGTGAGCRCGDNGRTTNARTRRTAPRNGCQPERKRPPRHKRYGESTSKSRQEEELQEEGKARRPYGHRAYPGHLQQTPS